MQTAELPLPGRSSEDAGRRARGETFAFDVDSLGELRRFVARHGVAAGLAEERVTDLVIAAAELGANSVAHGGGRGEAAVRRERDAIVLKISDAGFIEDLEVGKVQPPPRQDHGRGLWIVRQVCDSVQIRSSESGTAVRLRFSLVD